MSAKTNTSALRNELILDSLVFEAQEERLHEMASFLNGLHAGYDFTQSIEDVESVIDEGSNCELWDLFVMSTMSWTDNEVVEKCLIENFNLEGAELFFEYSENDVAYYSGVKGFQKILVQITGAKSNTRKTVINGHHTGIFATDCEDMTVWIDGLVQLHSNGIDSVTAEYSDVMRVIQMEAVA